MRVSSPKSTISSKTALAVDGFLEFVGKDVHFEQSVKLFRVRTTVLELLSVLTMDGCCAILFEYLERVFLDTFVVAIFVALVVAIDVVYIVDVFGDVGDVGDVVESVDAVLVVGLLRLFVALSLLAVLTLRRLSPNGLSPEVRAVEVK